MCEGLGITYHTKVGAAMGDGEGTGWALTEVSEVFEKSFP